jgi:hypothetical protein
MGRPGRAQRPKTTVEQDGEASKLKELTMHTHQKSSDPVATIGLDIGKNTFHLVGLDQRGAIAMRIKVSRNQLTRRLVSSCHQWKVSDHTVRRCPVRHVLSVQRRRYTADIDLRWSEPIGRSCMHVRNRLNICRGRGILR